MPPMQLDGLLGDMPSGTADLQLGAGATIGSNRPSATDIASSSCCGPTPGDVHIGGPLSQRLERLERNAELLAALEGNPLSAAGDSSIAPTASAHSADWKLSTVASMAAVASPPAPSGCAAASSNLISAPRWPSKVR